MIIYIKENLASPFKPITVADKPFSGGGQGDIYKVETSPYGEYCLKYYKGNLADIHYERIKFMIENVPDNIMGHSGFRICWPTAFAYDENRRFIGYLMPLAFSGSRDLLILSTYNAKPISEQPRYRKCPEWFDKFEINTSHGMQNRMKMLCNWIIAIESIHRTGKYVIIDLKPENVMATASGKISIIDTDSFQISENGRVLFEGPVFTPEYFPPEGAAIEKSKRPFPVTVDYFAAAVCFYKILTGVHPYAGTIKKPPYDRLELIAEAIQYNLFAFGENKRYLSFNDNFNLHKHFENLPVTIQQTFIRAFGRPEQRPGMQEWSKVLRSVLQSSGTIKGNTVKPKADSTPAIRITDVSFREMDPYGNLITRVRSDVYYTDAAYLMPYISYKVLKSGRPNVKIWYKVESPDGYVYEGSERKGFAGSYNLDISGKGASSQVWETYISGVGNDDRTFFHSGGFWKFEFYEDNTLLFKCQVYLNESLPIQPSGNSSSASSSSTSSHGSKKSSDDSAAGCLWSLFFVILVGCGLWFGGGWIWNKLFGDSDYRHDYVQVLPGIWNGNMNSVDVSLEIDSISQDSLINGVLSGVFDKTRSQRVSGYIGNNDSIYLDAGTSGKYFNGKFRIGMTKDGKEILQGKFFDGYSGDTIYFYAHKDEVARVKPVNKKSSRKKSGRRKKDSKSKNVPVSDADGQSSRDSYGESSPAAGDQASVKDGNEVRNDELREDAAGKDDMPGDGMQDMTEERASFPGGMAAFSKWMSREMRYPESAVENGIEGRVIVSFMVEKDGSISNAEILSGVSRELDGEALRLVRKMPRWNPGRSGGETVRERFNLPITFKLQR